MLPSDIAAIPSLDLTASKIPAHHFSGGRQQIYRTKRRSGHGGPQLVIGYGFHVAILDEFIDLFGDDLALKTIIGAVSQKQRQKFVKI
jgi:hypothetical protein